MPSGLHHFLVNYLRYLRLDTSSANDENSNDSMPSKISKSFLFIIAIVLCLLLLIGGFAIFEKAREKTTGKRTAYAAWMTNFSLRFVYQVSLEICIFILVQYSADDESCYSLAIGILGTIGLIVAVGLLVSLFFRGGPYVDGTFAENSLLKSWWGVRTTPADTVLDLQTPKSDKSTPAHTGQQEENSEINFDTPRTLLGVGR